ncbi:MAG: tetratricopeptide repeat protein [Planctomycetota bacterium]|jgi:hypothetical protein
MKKALSTTILALIAVPLAAQRDRIQWTDGTVTDRCTVTAYSLQEIKYRKGGQDQIAPSDRVSDLTIDKVRDRYKQAYGASMAEQPATFLQIADKRFADDAFLGQFGYIEATRRFVKAGDASSAFAALDQLAQKYPTSAFLPDTFTIKIQHYLGREKSGDASKVAVRYKQTATGQAYPKGYQIEADYYETLTSGRNGSLPPSQVRGNMQRIFNEAGSDHPIIANMARLELANSLLAEKKNAEAKREYEEILDQPNLDQRIRGGAWYGLGRVQYAAGNPGAKEHYHDALLSFLRVYVSNRDADPIIVAEARDYGAMAAEKWGGTDAGRMNRRLKTILRQEFPDWVK